MVICEDIQVFLDEVAITGSGSGSDFIHALGTAAKVKGMTYVAKEDGNTRASSCKSSTKA